MQTSGNTDTHMAFRRACLIKIVLKSSENQGVKKETVVVGVATFFLRGVDGVRGKPVLIFRCMWDKYAVELSHRTIRYSKPTFLPSRCFTSKFYGLTWPGTIKTETIGTHAPRHH